MASGERSIWENSSRASKARAGYYRKQCMHGGKDKNKVRFFSYFWTSKLFLVQSATPAISPTSCAGTQRTAYRGGPISVRADPIHPSSGFLHPTIPYIEPNQAQV